jgi:hypothetical protein
MSQILLILLRLDKAAIPTVEGNLIGVGILPLPLKAEVPVCCNEEGVLVPEMSESP